VCGDNTPGLVADLSTFYSHLMKLLGTNLQAGEICTIFVGESTTSIMNLLCDRCRAFSREVTIVERNAEEGSIGDPETAKHL
jgi:hypothetical protein